MSQAIRYGRAEYETVTDLFEGISARILVSNLFNDTSPKMIIGDPGNGKTRLVKVLSQEGVQLNAYNLEKEKLLRSGEISYTSIVETKKPVAYVLDDLGYLLKFMRLSKLRTGENREEEVLYQLQDVREKARSMNAVPIFVADESPAGLCLRFENENHRREFLGLLEGCLYSNDDATVFLRYLGRYHGYVTNIINFNNRGIYYGLHRSTIYLTDESKLRLWPDDTAPSESEIKISERRARENLIKTFRIKDLPLFYPHSICKVAFYPMSQEGHITGDVIVNFTHPFDLENLSHYGWYSNPPGIIQLATMRQLKIVSERYGELSRANLKINFGEEGKPPITTDEYINGIYDKPNGIYYKPEEIVKIRRAIFDMYHKVVKFDFGELVDRLASTSTEKDWESALIESDLKLE